MSKTKLQRYGNRTVLKSSAMRDFNGGNGAYWDRDMVEPMYGIDWKRYQTMELYILVTFKNGEMSITFMALMLLMPSDLLADNVPADPLGHSVTL
jgi:hypothetical protein